jgi:hypothetical protein
VTNTSGFPSSGKLTLISSAGSQFINYTSKTSTQFLGVTTGGTGTVSSSTTIAMFALQDITTSGTGTMTAGGAITFNASGAYVSGGTGYSGGNSWHQRYLNTGEGIIVFQGPLDAYHNVVEYFQFGTKVRYVKPTVGNLYQNRTKTLRFYNLF